MDTNELLEQILAAGRQLATQGKEAAQQGVGYAADKMGIPDEEGPERDAALANLKKGAVVGGLVALLLGTKSGRKLASPLVKIGSVAAVGGLAYKAYTNWQKTKGIESSEPAELVEGQAANERSRILLTAMIAAAKSDGHIDSDEQSKITNHINESDLGEATTNLLLTEIQKPLNISEVAAHANSPEAAVEIYLTSLIIVDQENEKEKQYLNELARELNLDDDLVRHLEEETLASV